MSHHSRRAAQWIVAAAAPLTLLAPARAANVSWSSPTSGRWLVPANWSPAAVPTSADSVTIDAPGSYTVTLDLNTSAGPVTLDAPGATLSLATNPVSFNTGALAVSAGTLAIQSVQTLTTQIRSTSFTNAGTVTFGADVDASTPGQLFADIFTGSGAVINSGTIETHPAATPPPPQIPHYPPTYGFTGNPGATFTNTGTLRAAAGTLFNLNKYTLNQNAGLLDRGISILSGALNYNGGACSPDVPVYLGNSSLRIAAAATAGNFILADNTSTITSNIPAGNTVSTWGTAPVRWTGVGSTFTNAGRLVVGHYPYAPSTTTFTPSFSLGSSTSTLLNTGTLELNSPNLPATSFTGSITNQGAITVNAANTATSAVPTRLSGSFTQNAGGSLTIDPSAPLALSNLAHFYFNGGTVSGPVSLDTSTVHFAPGLANTGGGTFSYSTSATNPAAPFTGDIPSGATFVHVSNSTGTTTVALPSFANAGAFRTTAAPGNFRPIYRINNYFGTLTNTGSLGGTYNGADRGIFLEIDGTLTNTGDIKAYSLTVAGDTTGAPRPSFNQNAGTLNVDNICTVLRAIFNYNGGTLSGKPVALNASTLNIAPGTNPASFQFYSGTCTLHGTPAPGSSLSLDSLTQAAVTVNVSADPFSNAGTLSFASTLGSCTSTLTVTGSGALTNTGTLSVTKGLGGTRTLNANVVNTGTFSVGPGATLTLNGTLTTTTPLDLQGTLDLRTGPLTWSFVGGASPIDTVRTLLATSHLVNSTADANHRLGYRTAPDDASLLVSLSLNGDANLNGKLDADDYALLDRAFAQSSTSAHWTDGDFNYDGAITSADYLLIDATLATQQGGHLSPEFLSMRESQFGADYVSSLIATVPEPSTLLAACGLAILPLSRRRRP